MTGDPSQQLCTSCGLCCDGTIYDHAKLTPAEAGTLGRSGARIVVTDDGSAILQPCGLLTGTLCSIYPDRPASCRRFRCEVLRGLEEGRTSVDQALGHVATARALATKAAAFLLDGQTLSAARKSWLAWSQGSEGDFGAHLDAAEAKRFHLAMLALNLYLDRHFRKPHQAVLTALEGPAAPPP